MTNTEKLDWWFDDLLYQTLRGKVTHKQLENGIRFDQFEQVKKWSSKYGYKFNIYSNDHLIDGKCHFHFENKANTVKCKVDFDGNILENSGINYLPNNIYKELKYFLSKESNFNLIIEIWNNKNPNSKFINHT